MHTTVVLAAILFLSIPSSLQAGVLFTMVLSLAQAGNEAVATLSVLYVDFNLNRDGHNTSEDPTAAFFSVAHVTKP